MFVGCALIGGFFGGGGSSLGFSSGRLVCCSQGVVHYAGIHPWDCVLKMPI